MVVRIWSETAVVAAAVVKHDRNLERRDEDENEKFTNLVGVKGSDKQKSYERASAAVVVNSGVELNTSFR